MAALVLKDAVCWIGPYSFNGISKSIALAEQQDAPESTPFGVTARTYVPGLRGTGLQIEGFWDATADLAMIGTLLGASYPVTWAPISTAGTLGARTFRSIATNYNIGGRIGDVFPFSAGAVGVGPAARGALFENGTRNATGGGTTLQLGAVGATQRLRSAFHVISGTGTLDVTIQSDDNSGMTTPTTMATLAQFTGAGSAFTEVVGAGADDWWRYSFTVSGGGSFVIAASMGIGPV